VRRVSEWEAPTELSGPQTASESAMKEPESERRTGTAFE
jgi:hypothetical protein